MKLLLFAVGDIIIGIGIFLIIVSWYNYLNNLTDYLDGTKKTTKDNNPLDDMGCALFYTFCLLVMMVVGFILEIPFLKWYFNW